MTHLNYDPQPSQQPTYDPPNYDQQPTYEQPSDNQPSSYDSASQEANAIEGIVWFDKNGNNKQDGSEQGIQGIRVFIDSNENKPL